MRVWGTLAGAAAIALVATVALRPNERSSPPVAVFAPPVCDIWAKSGRDEIGYWGENERGMKFRYIPPGRLDVDAFRFVAVSNGYWIQTTEVTREQWTATGWSDPSFFTDRPDLPVEMVTWTDCARFAGSVGEGYRLPTRNEWEYACRAGATSTYCFGDDARDLGDYAWFGGNAGERTHPVGTRKPNAWGLYDMHGNVWEFVAGRDTGAGQPHRGGSWYSDARSCRATLWECYKQTYRCSNVGFRLARTPAARTARKADRE